MNEPISIVMTTWQRWEMTEKSLYSLKKNTPEPHRVIVIDNGSDYQGWLTMAKKEGYIDVLVLLDKNYGLEHAKNLGMNFVESDLFVSTDNDILASYGWLTKMKDLMARYPDYGAISCRPQVLVGTGDLFGTNPPEVQEFNHVAGYLRIMRTQLTRETGAWNDKRPLRGHEEYWISEKMNRIGWKTGWASYVPCYHLFGNDEEIPNTDGWGYSNTMRIEDHGHNPVGGLPKNDWKIIKEKFL